MSTVPEAIGRSPAAPARHPRQAIGSRIAAAWPSLRFPLTIYALTRLAYLLIAVADSRLHAWHLGWEFSNWDGIWYLLVVAAGYPTHVMHTQSTLGFLPLYPLILLAARNLLHVHPVITGMVVSTLTGAIATVLAGELSASWWGESVRRRAIVFFCVFPGSIVFSMLYTEGLMLALVMGCLLALQQRRWLLAGLLAGGSTAVGPVAVAIIPATAVAAALAVRERREYRALLAPLLAPAGVAAFAAYLWVHTGTPLASYTAQRYGWHEESTPLALWHTAVNLFRQLENFDITDPHVNLNLVAGLVGAAFLFAGLRLLARQRRRTPPAALTWTAFVTLLIVTSAQTPPNPRMLIVCFPAVLVYAQRWSGTAYARMLALTGVLTVAMSFVTYVGTGLRP